MVKHLVSLQALVVLRSPAAKATLTRFASDRSVYAVDTTTRGRDGKVTPAKSSRAIADLANEALGAL